MGVAAATGALAGVLAGVLRCHTTMPTMISASGITAASQIQLGRPLLEVVGAGAILGGIDGEAEETPAPELGRDCARWRAACLVFLLMTCVQLASDHGLAVCSFMWL